MTRSKRDGKSDPHVQQVLGLLSEYQQKHPQAKTDVYRQNNYSIRIRVIDPDFKGMDLVDRDDAMWKYLDRLPADTISEISLLVLLTPKEKQSSFANMEFEDPTSSGL